MDIGKSNSTGDDGWLTYVEPNPQARLRLFCFPYAGGSALIFREWQAHLPNTVEVCPVELPGRGTRLAESPATRLSPLVQAVAEAFYPYLDKPFAFFGHSFGALLSFELACYLRREHGLVPAHLFVSAHRAPQTPNPDPTTHTLPDHELVERLRRLGGTPDVILREPELMELVLPIVRKDFEVCDTYVYSHELPLGCPISAFGGLKDPIVSYAELQPWAEKTSASFVLYMLPGGHLFVNTSRARLLNTLSLELEQVVKRM
jgi:medium-chain acyl-[acyl-carrier-protein] hydrolase